MHLAELQGVVEPELAAHAVGAPLPTDRFPGGTQRAFVLEAVHEGWLMHYGRARAFAGMDDDLCLLGGDSLYALGLERLAQAGDVPAVSELADLISLCATLAAEDRAAAAEPLWEASAALLLQGEGGGARAAFAGLRK